MCNYIETKYGALKSCSVIFDGFLDRKSTWEGKKVMWTYERNWNFQFISAREIWLLLKNL